MAHREPFGVAAVTVVPVRAEPRETAEMVTQVLLGETFDVLEYQAGFWRVRLHVDAYEGWVSEDQVLLWSQEEISRWTEQAERFTERSGVVVLDPHDPLGNSRPVVVGSLLCWVDRRRSRVALPDGSIGRLYVEARPSRLFAPHPVLASALLYLGTPYLWGGRSPFGIDCSGLVQMAYLLHGIRLPRDAWQQFSCGEPLETDWRTWRPGDLVFFSRDGTKITHVGIYGGDGAILHASGMVRWNSLDPGQGRFEFSPRLQRTLVGARRILSVVEVSAVQ
jgi:cell wall-associated NlpC family hydrolase|nr:MAG: hydrolase Nlp/P60 [Bacteroidota bacterium]